MMTATSAAGADKTVFFPLFFSNFFGIFAAMCLAAALCGNVLGQGSGAGNQEYNQSRVEDYLNRIFPSVSSGDLSTVLTNINALGSANLTAFDFALDQIGGQVYGSLAQTGFQNTAVVNDTLGSVLRWNISAANNRNVNTCDENDCNPCEPCEPCGPCEPCVPICVTKNAKRSVWGLGFGIGGESQFDGNAYGYRQSFGGSIIGVDRAYRNSRAGAFFSYGKGNIRSALLDKSESEEILAGLYWYRKLHAGYFTAQAGLGNKNYDTRRTISFVNRTARSRHDAFTGTLYLEQGVNLNPWQIFMGMQYIGSRENGFTERGAGSLNLTARATDADSLQSIFGCRFEASYSSRLSLSGNAAWVHDFADLATTFTAGFAGYRETFTIQGIDPGHDWMKLGFGGNYRYSNRLRLFAGYDVYVNYQQTLHTGSAGASYAW